MEDKRPSPMVLRYFLLFFLASILLVGRLFWPFFSILVLSFLLAGIFRPVYAFFNKRMSPSPASALTCIVIIIVVFVPLTFFVGALSQEAFGLYQLGKGAHLTEKTKELLQNSVLMTRVQDLLNGYGIDFKSDGFNKFLSDLAKMIGLFLYNQASAWAANIINFIFNFFIMILTIFFLLTDQSRLIDFLLRLSPLPDDQERRLIKKFDQIAGAILIGNGVCGLIQGVLGGVAFAFLGFSSPILWGGVMVILAFLPIFGIGLVLIPASLVLLMKGNIVGGVILIVFYLLLSFSIEYLVKPKMVGIQVKMHSLLVFLSILGGLSAFGFMGIIYGPLIIATFLTLADIYLTSYDRYVKNDGVN